MIQVTSTINIAESEIQLDFIRPSGPGGQNVNKVATSVQLRFDVRNSPSLNQDVKERLIKLVGSRVTEDGILIIEAKRYRTQEKNRVDALGRLISMIQQALPEPKARKKTKPPRIASANRLDVKHQRGQQKRIRHYDPDDWE